MSSMVLRLLPVVLTVALMGCGDGKVSVSGTVTYKGEPLSEGYIAFIPEGGGQGGGGPIANGRYTIRGQPGKNRVEITASKMMPLPPGQVGPYGEKESVQQYIPAKYNAKSELQRELPSGDPLDFALTP